jgi:ketosteroid isomerase-like protein
MSLPSIVLSTVLLFAALGSARMPATSPAAAVRQAAPSDSAAIAATIHSYHEALSAGDSLAALSLLTPDAAIVETGGIETLADYRAHHLASDISFARTVKQTRSGIHVRVRGDMAWATSTSESIGESRGRPVNSVGAELAVLTRTGKGWRISAFHWSSRSRRS